MSPEKKKSLAYADKKLEICNYIKRVLIAAKKQGKTINYNLMCEQIELDTGLGSKAIHRIVSIMENLKHVKVDGANIKIVPQKSED